MELSMMVGVFNLALIKTGAGFIFIGCQPASSSIKSMGSHARFRSWFSGIR